MSSPMTCGHANEVPNVCICPEACYCRVNACLPKRGESFDTEREANDLGDVLKILDPYILGKPIGCGSAREIQRQMVGLIQRAKQRGQDSMKETEFFDTDGEKNKFVRDIEKQAYRKGLLRGSEKAQSWKKRIKFSPDLEKGLDGDYYYDVDGTEIAEDLRKEAEK